MILHLFYPQSWKEIREYLLNLRPYHWDLCVTFPPFVKDALDFEDIKKIAGNVIFLETANAGYDIGPFLKAIKKVDLSSYDIVVKAQSKSVRRKMIFIFDQLFFGRGWFVNLFEGILGAHVVHKEIDNLLKAGTYGLAGAENLYVSDPRQKENMTVKRLPEKGFSVKPGYHFLAGTCFAATSAAIRLLERLDFSDVEFAMLPSSRGFSLGHLLERYLLWPAQDKGAKVCLNHVCGFRNALKKPLIAILRRFSSLRLFDLPYTYDDEYFFWKLDNKFVRFKRRRVRLGDLFYKRDDRTDAVKLERCVLYRYLMGDKECYVEYQRIHEQQGFPAMSPERFEKLIESLDRGGYDSKHVVMVNECNVIKDCQHRACYLAYKYGLDHVIDVLEVRVLNKNGILKLFIPDRILIHRFRKRNHLI